jgi:pyruvate-formate lyase-activating enzyme
MATTSNKLSNHLADTKTKLDSVGCGFCLAKWTQVTMHLQIGHTHSCHHPGTHPIPQREIKRNPSALHNTRFKKLRRKEMLENKRPTECDYCWNVEDSSNEYSDRTFKSSEPWSFGDFQTIKNLDWKEDFNPRYVEVSFSNACNFKCSYCSPQFSSKWMEEIKEYGGYPTTDNFNSLDYLIQEDKMPIPLHEENPYVDAFWKWWPDLYRDLHTFRMTGGEPLMSKDVWKVLDYIIEERNPNKQLSLAINSNLGVPDKLIDKLIEKINKITLENKVKDFVIFTSADASGERAEYIRNGLVYNKFMDNVDRILRECPRINITFMVTYNALSVPNYDKLIEEIYELKTIHKGFSRYWPGAILMDTSYLRHPQHQAVKTLQGDPNYDWSQNIWRQAELMNFLQSPYFAKDQAGFGDLEIIKMKRIYDWMISPDEEHIQRMRRFNFYNYFSNHDKRRGTNFVKTFPELEDFYNFCKETKL